MTPEQLCQEIKKAHESGESYATIAAKFNMSKPAIGRIIKGEKPKNPTCEKMKLEPSAKILRDRARRAKQRAELIELRSKWEHEKEILEYVECEAIPYLKNKGNSEKDIYPIAIAKVLQDMIFRARKTT